MAAGARVLTSQLLEWISARLLVSSTSGHPPPRWPPSEAILGALADGQLADALALPDGAHARYLVHAHLRTDAPHLLLAHDQWLEREVVIKLVISPGRTARLATAAEARLLARLHHPNVVVILEVDPHGHYLVLERLDADMRDLAHLGPELVIDAFCQAGRGLAAAHARGIFHGDFKPENVVVRVETDATGSISKLWAKVADFGSAREVGALPVTRARALAKDQNDFARALWECLTVGGRPPDGEDLIPGRLHAVLGTALMTEPSQRWADMTALVDAIERGRGTTAAASGPSTDSERVSARRMLERAIAHAEDGLFSQAGQQWRELRDRLTGCDDAELGRGGFSLGAAIFNSAARATGVEMQRGYQRCVDVLEDAIRSLEAAGDLDTTHEASLLAATACDAWKNTYSPDTTEHQHLDQLARAFRERT